MLKYLRARSTVKWNWCQTYWLGVVLCADDGTAALKDESLDTSSHLCSQNKISSLDMNLGDPDVLETIWMKALENCSSPPLQNLLLKDGKLSSLYTTQGNLLFVCGTSFFCFTGRQIRLSLNSRVPASCSCCLLWSTLTHLSRQLVIATFQKAHVCLDICMI